MDKIIKKYKHQTKVNTEFLPDHILKISPWTARIGPKPRSKPSIDKIPSVQQIMGDIEKSLLEIDNPIDAVSATQTSAMKHASAVNSMRHRIDKVYSKFFKSRSYATILKSKLGDFREISSSKNTNKI